MQTAILTCAAAPPGLTTSIQTGQRGATFQALPGASFVVNGARQATESALTTASAEASG